MLVFFIRVFKKTLNTQIYVRGKTNLLEKLGPLIHGHIDTQNPFNNSLFSLVKRCIEWNNSNNLKEFNI